LNKKLQHQYVASVKLFMDQVSMLISFS